jgi:hypothetical protein
MKNLWTREIYPIKTEFFTKKVLNNTFNKFWSKIVETIKEDKHILILLRLQFNDDRIVTIGQLQKLNSIEYKKEWIDYILNIIELKTDYYIETPIKNIIYSYGIRKGKSSNLELKNKNKQNVTTQLYYNNKLPITFNPLDYGIIIQETKIDKGIKFIIAPTNKSLFIIDQIKEEYNLVEYYKNNKLVIKWKDIYISELSFIREIGKSKYTYEKLNLDSKYELVLIQTIKPVKYIQKIKSKIRTNK